jgi:hypothetical protein
MGIHRRRRAHRFESLENRDVPSIAGGPHAVVVAPVIAGAVRDASTGAGVAGVGIQLLDSEVNPRVIRMTRTDSLGRFAFANVPMGPYIVREAAQRTGVQDRLFLGGLPVGVHDIDPATGGPYPALSLRYTSNHSILIAGAVGGVIGPGLGASIPPEPDPAAVAFVVRSEAIRQFMDPLVGDRTATYIDTLVRAGLLGVSGTAMVL